MKKIKINFEKFSIKGIFKNLVVIILIAFVMYGFVLYNLKANSVYYAKNVVTQNGFHPTAQMLLHNMSWINCPEIDTLEYDFDGNVAISDKNSLKESYYVCDGGDGQYPEIHIHDKDISYFVTRDYKISYASGKSFNSILLSEVNEENVLLKMDDFLSPIVDNVQKPLINLQFIFNYKYRDVFKPVKK